MMIPIEQWIKELQLNGDFVADGRKIQADAYAQGRADALKGPHDEPKMLLPGNAIEDAEETGRMKGLEQAAAIAKNWQREDTKELCCDASQNEGIAAAILAAIPRKEGTTKQ